MGNIFQLKMSLMDIKPKIWRRFFVNSNISFHKLHEIIQKVMGWDNYHLYSFSINRIRIELPDEEGYSEYSSENSRKVKLNEYIKGEKQKINYLYDFGDSWEHEIIVEKILDSLPENVVHIPYCIDGERACPPEDCGGIGGYERVLELLSTGKDSWGEAEELKEWLGDWNPEEFSVNEINKSLNVKDKYTS